MVPTLPLLCFAPPPAGRRAGFATFAVNSTEHNRRPTYASPIRNRPATVSRGGCVSHTNHNRTQPWRMPDAYRTSHPPSLPPGCRGGGRLRKI
jgi:hypothetical protein